MYFTILDNHVNGSVRTVADALIAEFQRRGHIFTPGTTDGITFALNLSTIADPILFRRRSRSVFVVTIVAHEAANEETLRTVSYRTLIRTLSNLVVCLVPEAGGGLRAHFTTPEAGFYSMPFEVAPVCDRIAPIVGAHWATDNQLDRDLPARLCDGSDTVDALRRGALELDTLGVLPLPFPLESILSEEDRVHLYKIFGITGASYGNLSAREDVPEFGSATFWMTGRGVDKRNLRVIGQDVLLVKGFDEKRNIVLLSVPDGSPDTARVSVDAIEHFLIYREFPEVRAIVHAHAWLDGVRCSKQNHPCGTWELAQEVAAMVRQEPDPSRCAVGLRNHGLTITGHSLAEIFDRIRGRLLVNVPMFA